ncbi:coil containing protein [Vibrio phage 1.173.O._10N.261.55.A11]|nr:coil containing protein [Vibrio phage 1.173.O._10N.261.55.A11]
MSDLDNAINSINASAAKAENTATFLDDMSTFDDQSSVTNPNNGQTVASIPKQVKDRTDELFTAAESDINQAVSDAEQSATDAQDAADSIGRYQGLWPDSGGSADKGDTYQTQVSGTPTGQYFTALQNTTVDPVGDDANWREVARNQKIQTAGGDSLDIIVQAPESTGLPCLVRMTSNSSNGMTFNGKPLKVLDIYATEESQWTHSGYDSAAKDKPKTDVYRSVYQNVLSADVTYVFVYHESGDFWEVLVDKIYKHAFIPCGSGKEITELQDAFGFVAQFSLSKAMDPLFQNVNANTEFYPNKPQISISIPAGTSEAPVISVMNKAVRAGEHNLNGVEVINEGRYDNNTDPETAIIDMSGVPLGADDLACFNLWKSDLGEVHGVTFRYWGDFDFSNQGVIRYQRSEARFKACIIDVENCTFTGLPGGVSALYHDRFIEGFGITIKCPTGTNRLIALNTQRSPIGSVTVTGNPYIFARVGGDVTFENVDIQGNPTFLLTNREPASVSFIGTSTIGAGTLRETSAQIPQLSLYISTGTTVNNLTVIPDKHYVYDNAYEHLTEALRIAHKTGLGTVEFLNQSGSAAAKVGKIQSQASGLDMSGDGATGHWSIDGGGTLYPITDNSYRIGFAGKRVTDLYIVNNPTVGSDVRIKTDRSSIPQALCDFVMGVEIEQYKLIGGDSGRYHYGIVITEDFLDRLNLVYSVDECAALCHSVFTDDKGDPINMTVGTVELGDLWQVRYAEWQNIMLEAMRRKIMSI